MHSTTQTSLYLPARDLQTLDAMATLYGTMKRELYARIAAQGGKAKSHKTAFCREPAFRPVCSTQSQLNFRDCLMVQASCWMSSARIRSRRHAASSASSMPGGRAPGRDGG